MKSNTIWLDICPSKSTKKLSLAEFFAFKRFKKFKV